jgi:holo-[acyl-carrier protein] synthase
VGIDLLEPERLRQAVGRTPRLVYRLFTTSEQADAAERPDPVAYLCGCFCAKEAVIKALALRGWHWLEIEVRHGLRSQVVLGGSALDASQAAQGALELSVSVSPGMATAVALLTPISAQP